MQSSGEKKTNSVASLKEIQRQSRVKSSSIYCLINIIVKHVWFSMATKVHARTHKYTHTHTHKA